MCGPSFRLCAPPEVWGSAKLLGDLAEATFCMQSVAPATLHRSHRLLRLLCHRPPQLPVDLGVGRVVDG